MDSMRGSNLIADQNNANACPIGDSFIGNSIARILYN